MRVILIRTNLTDRDPWLAKNIDTLKRGGYEVILLAWDRYGKDSETRQWETEDDHNAVKLKLRAPWGITIIPLLPIWWCFVLAWLLRNRWDVAQAVNLDSILPGLIAARLKRRSIIYQIYDVYADVMILPEFVRQIAICVEKLFMRLASAVIISNETQEKEVKGIPNRHTVPIYNPPPDLFGRAKPRDNSVFTILYAGVLYRSRKLNIDRVFQSIRDIDGVRLVIAGYGDMVEDVEQWVRQANGKAEFIGRLSYPQVLEQTLASDLLFALASSTIPTARHAPSCNKLMEAMMAHKPILVTKDTAMADVVNHENCGLVVDPDNVQEIRHAILALKEDSELCRRLGANGRKAYEQKYSREIMERRLLDLYARISRESN